MIKESKEAMKLRGTYLIGLAQFFGVEFSCLHEPADLVDNFPDQILWRSLLRHLCGHCLITGHKHLLSIQTILVTIVNILIILTKISLCCNKLFFTTLKTTSKSAFFSLIYRVFSCKGYLRKWEQSKELFFRHWDPYRHRKC